MSPSRLDEFGRLAHVALKHARDVFRDDDLDAQWQAHGFTARPDAALAARQYDDLVAILTDAGASIQFLPPDPDTTIDSIYVRDASIVTPRGLVLANMGKRLRASEPAAQARALAAGPGQRLPIVARIEDPGRIEGGDVVWFDETHVAVGRGYRTNADGIRQLRALVGPSVEVIDVPLPHWRGPGDVLHLMSFLSPVDRDLAVVYSPLMPVPFRERLIEMGIALVETPEAEFESMGTNVLAVGPRHCVMLAGNPLTRAALERAGARVEVYEGSEISGKGAGGPTCLTRPLARVG